MIPSTRTAALLSTVSPFPPDNGKSVVIGGFLHHLRRRLGAEEVHFLHVGKPLEDTIAFDGIRVHEMGEPSRAEQVRSVVVNAGLRRRSLQETLTYSPSVARRIRATLGVLGVDLEVIDTVRMEQYVRGHRSQGRRVLYLDDLFSVRYQRMLDVLRRYGAGFDPLGQFGPFVPERLRFLTRMNTSRRLLLQIERRRIDRAERSAARASDVSVLLNPSEACLLGRTSGADVEVVPPQLPDGGPKNPSSWNGRPDFAFVALLSAPHNDDALTWFLDACMPEVLRRRPDARLHVIGHGASSALSAAFRRFDGNVIRHGFVPDLDPILGQAAALVNPLRFGSGIKIKVLEALARGLPVVATEVGAEGIVERSAPGLAIENEPLRIASAMVTMADPARRRVESAGALRIYQELFSAEVAEIAYDRIFGIDAADLPSCRGAAAPAGAAARGA